MLGFSFDQHQTKASIVRYNRESIGRIVSDMSPHSLSTNFVCIHAITVTPSCTENSDTSKGLVTQYYFQIGQNYTYDEALL